MFRFVYALAADEIADPTWAADGFVGIEAAAAREGLPWIGTRQANADASVPAAPVGPAYVIVPSAGPDEGVATAGRRLRELAEAGPASIVLIENGGPFATAATLWSVLEAARHPRVKVAIDVDAARAAGQSAAVLVPTLNLRIGLVRVRQLHDDLTGYGKRLAGIGFEGYVVIDPPPGDGRADKAVAIANLFKSIFPTKPAKKPVPAKA